MRGPALHGFSSVSGDEAASTAAHPDALLADADLKQHLAEAISQLPERAQQVLGLYYQEECTQAEIGQILGVTESRVCQILGDATMRLRALMDETNGGAGRKPRTRR
jgi:RNA polymerase sigma factor for flagellar operon FliA